MHVTDYTTDGPQVAAAQKYVRMTILAQWSCPHLGLTHLGEQPFDQMTSMLRRPGDELWRDGSGADLRTYAQDLVQACSKA